jgi:hypothetical protein
MLCRTALYFPFSDHQNTNDVQETQDLESFSSKEKLWKIGIFSQDFFLFC